MKGKVIRGSHPRGLFNYLLGTDKTKKNIRGRVIGGNMTPPVYPADPAVLTNIFIKSTRARKKPCKKPVLHIPLRMPKGEDVSVETWVAIAKALMIEMEISTNRPWTLIKHPDEHVHLVTSRINYKGDLWYGKWEAFELIKATHKLEKDFKLTVTPTLQNPGKDRIRLSSGQIYKKTRLQAVGEDAYRTPNEKLAELIPAAILQSDGNFKKFERYLSNKAVEVQLSHHKSGEVYGISFKFENAAIKGSKIARAFSWKGITDLLETQKAAFIADQQARRLVSNTELAPPAAEPIPADPIPEIAPTVAIIPQDSNQQATDADVNIVGAKPKNVPVIVSSVPASKPITPESLPSPAQTLDELDPKLWDENIDAWKIGKEILVDQFRFDPKLIARLHVGRRLWFLNDNTLVTARLALPASEMVGVALTQVVPRILPSTILVPDQQGLFTIGKLSSAYERVIVTKNAIEAISYHQLSQSRCEYTPPGLVVSADAELPPPWLVDWVIKSKKKLFLATKTQLTPQHIAKALPQLVMNGQFIGSYEPDVSNAPSWHDLLLERINLREMAPGINVPAR